MQHLAYLKDGEVKRVQNGMLGAVRPMNLISLKDHAAAEKQVLEWEQKERKAQAEFLKSQQKLMNLNLSQFLCAQRNMFSLHDAFRDCSGQEKLMNLNSLKDHAAAEKKLAKLQAKERIAQAEWVKHGGMTENERALIAHAEAEKKILELQKLAYLENDEVKHGNSGLLGAVRPMNLSDDGDFLKVQSVESLSDIDTEHEFMITVPFDVTTSLMNLRSRSNSNDNNKIRSRSNSNDNKKFAKVVRKSHKSHSHDKKKITLKQHAAAEAKILKAQKKDGFKYVQKAAKMEHAKALKKHARAEAKVPKEYKNKQHHHHHHAKKVARQHVSESDSGEEDLQNLVWYDESGVAHKDSEFAAIKNAQAVLAASGVGAKPVLPMFQPGDDQPLVVVPASEASVGGVTAATLTAMGVPPATAAQILTAATVKAPKVKNMPKATKAQQTAQTAQIVSTLIQQGVSPVVAAQLAQQMVTMGNGAAAAPGGALSEFVSLQNLALLDKEGQIHRLEGLEGLQNLAFLGKDGKVHHAEQALLGASAPLSLQNLSQFTQDVQLGNTEYALISLWFVFTAIVFGLLYKITKEAVCDDKEEKIEKKTQSNIKVEYLDNSAKEALV